MGKKRYTSMLINQNNNSKYNMDTYSWLEISNIAEENMRNKQPI